MGALYFTRPTPCSLTPVFSTVPLEEHIAQELFLVRCQLIQHRLLFPVRLPTVLFGSIRNGFHLGRDLLEFLEYNSIHRFNLVVRLSVGW